MTSHSLTFADLAQYFHMPITDVSLELGICATVLKKICRRVGIQRWPHRKIKSVDRMIQLLESTEPKSPEEHTKLLREIESLQKKREMIMTGPIPSSDRIRSAEKFGKKHNVRPRHSMNLRDNFALDSPDSQQSFDEDSNKMNESPSPSSFYYSSSSPSSSSTSPEATNSSSEFDKRWFSSHNSDISSSSSTNDKLLPIITATERDYHIFFPSSSSSGSDESGASSSGDDELHPPTRSITTTVKSSTTHYYETVINQLPRTTSSSSSDPLVEKFAKYDRPRMDSFRSSLMDYNTTNNESSAPQQQPQLQQQQQTLQLAKIWDEAELILNLAQPKLPIIEPDLCRPTWVLEDKSKNMSQAPAISVGPPLSK